MVKSPESFVEQVINLYQIGHDLELPAIKGLLLRANHYQLVNSICIADDVNSLGNWFEENTVMHKLWDWKSDLHAPWYNGVNLSGLHTRDMTIKLRDILRAHM